MQSEITAYQLGYATKAENAGAFRQITLLVLRHARRQKEYVPVLEDWIWHTIIPFLAYVGFFVSGIWLPRDPAPCLFVIGAAALLLLFVGIHNAWDSVTYIAVGRRQEPNGTGKPRQRGRR